MSPRPEEEHMREGVVKRIRHVVKQLWPDAQVSMLLYLHTFLKLKIKLFLSIFQIGNIFGVSYQQNLLCLGFSSWR